MAKDQFIFSPTCFRLIWPSARRS